LLGVGEKGSVDVEITAAGTGGHSSMPPPQTAVGRLAAAVALLEEHPMPARPEGSEAGILEGLYRWSPPPEAGQRATILFSGSAQGAARAAQAELAEHYGVGAQLFSATSYKKLREEALEVERWNRLHPDGPERVPLVTQLLAGAGGPVIAVTDYMKAVPDQVARWVPGTFVPLGTDGFGRSDTREALRRHFEVDAGHVVVAVLSALAEQGAVEGSLVTEAIQRYGIDPELADPRVR
jgi:pyruvate dehydrogenase E1 component